MSNIIKYNLSTSPNSIQSGNFNVAVNNTPTNLTGFYNGISPINGGYTIYINKESNGPSIYVPQNDSDLIQIVKQLGGNVSTAAESLVWINSQSNMTVLNNNYPSIVTSGLVLNVDAGFVSSYPKTGTTWKDLSGGGNNGTLVNGPTYSSGSIVFDGADDRVQTTYSPNFGDFTVCLIFKDNGSNAWGRLVDKLYTTGFFISSYFASSGANYVGAGIIEPNYPYGIALPYESGKYHYFASVRNGTTHTIYLDGITQTTSKTVSSNLLDSTSIAFGDWSGGVSQPFKGDLPYVQIYNRALSAAEVLQNYYAGLQRFIPTDGLVLSLDAQNTNLYAISPTTAYDVSGNNINGTLTNGVQYVGDGNGSWRFDGVDDVITLGYQPLLNNTDITQEAWVNGNSFTSWHGIISNMPSWGTGFSLQIGIIQNIAAMVSGTYLKTSWAPSVNVWYHIVATHRSSDNFTALYVNGVLENTTTQAVTYSENAITTIGVFYTSGSLPFNGEIGSVKTYNRALTATEVTTIYNATKSRYGL
jgi:hypothetical protein